MTLPILILAVGNPSRGDDALGPMLAERVERARLPGVEVVTDFQLQVEHALDLVGRARVIFVDAGTGTEAPFEFRRVHPAADFLHTSHALAPEAVLATYVKVQGEPPPECWVLCVRGERFELGEGLSQEAAEHLEVSWQALQDAVACDTMPRFQDPNRPRITCSPCDAHTPAMPSCCRLSPNARSETLSPP